MPKFLIEGSYGPDGLKGLLKEGGSGRKAAVEKMLAGLNGKVEGIYYALGDSDVFVLVDTPNTISMAAISLAVNATGLVKITTTSLLTVEEMDEASKTIVNYRPPKA